MHEVEQCMEQLPRQESSYPVIPAQAGIQPVRLKVTMNM
jgi:hypothetical protein